MYCKATGSKDLVSIILPIYNVEKYLSQCIDSIISQTYSNIEILLVDDGSLDGCGKICDEYATKDSRIKVLHIPNGGVAKARQLGVYSSSGEYIVFVDPDDWVPADAIEYLYNALTPDFDIVIGALYYYNDKIRIKIPSKLRDDILSKNEYLKELILKKGLFGPWCKIFRKNLFCETSFPMLKRGQDTLMNIEVGCNTINKIKYIPNYVYYYREGSSSSSFSYSTYSFDFCYSYCEIISQTLKRECVYESLEKEYALLCLNFMITAIQQGDILRFNNNNWVEYIKNVLKKYNISFVDQIKLKIIISPYYRYTIKLIYSLPILNRSLRMIYNIISDMKTKKIKFHQIILYKFFSFFNIRIKG